MSTDRQTASSADRFAAIMWQHFLDGCSIDGADLQDAIERSGLGEVQPATAEDVERDTEGVTEVGDGLIVLSDDGRACVKRGAG